MRAAAKSLLRQIQTRVELLLAHVAYAVRFRKTPGQRIEISGIGTRTASQGTHRLGCTRPWMRSIERGSPRCVIIWTLEKA